MFGKWIFFKLAEYGHFLPKYHPWWKNCILVYLICKQFEKTMLMLIIVLWWKPRFLISKTGFRWFFTIGWGWLKFHLSQRGYYSLTGHGFRDSNMELSKDTGYHAIYGYNTRNNIHDTNWLDDLVVLNSDLRHVRGHTNYRIVPSCCKYTIEIFFFCLWSWYTEYVPVLPFHWLFMSWFSESNGQLAAVKLKR